MKAVIVLLALFVTSSFAAQLKMTVVDMGAGLCTITKMSDGKFVVFDAGKGLYCKTKIKESIGDNPIDLLIISHADHDHYGGAIPILKDTNIKVNTVLHTGYIRKHKNKSYGPFLKQISDGANAGKFEEINLTKMHEYREKLQYGSSYVQIMSGYGHNHYGFKKSKDSYIRNSISIAAQFVFDGKSILITGDAKGRDTGKTQNCKYAEAEMVNHNSLRPLKSDVLVAGHHGADDTTAKCFLDKVKPVYVVYSAGNKHGHPRDLNAKRVLASGVKEENIYRTDRGSDEDSEYADDEWEIATQEDCKDGYGDDDVIISLVKAKEISVKYGKTNVCT